MRRHSILTAAWLSQAIACGGEEPPAGPGPGPGDECLAAGACATEACDGVNGCEYGVELTCDDGVDNDGDLLGDCFDSDCRGTLVCPVEVCGNDDDDDGDSLTDCADPDCLGVGCDDDEACTHTDVCGVSACAGTAYGCDDSQACTIDTCDGAGGCGHTPATGSCFIDGTCHADNEANPADTCQSCLVAVNQTAWSNNIAPCNDGDDCTRDDLCGGGICAGTPYSCDDSRACTTDVCDGAGGCSYPIEAGTCLIDSVCYAADDSRPGNACQYCAPLAHQSSWSDYQPGTGCNDGLACTSNDQCDDDGLCTGDLSGCPALACETPICNAVGGCDVAVNAGWCSIAGNCVADGAPNPMNPCQECDADADQTDWTDNTAPCNDANDCTMNDLCGNGTCAGTEYSCNDDRSCTTDSCDGDGTCTFAINSGFCLIGGICYAHHEDNPDNECLWCSTTTSQTAWSNKAAGTSCTSDDKTCTVDQCSNGTCTHAFDTTSGQCYISGTCYDDGAVNPTNECRYCNAPATNWDEFPDFTACSDGVATTAGDWCTGGLCDGFARQLYSNHGDTTSTGDEYLYAATYSLTGAYGVYRSPTSTTHYSDYFDAGARVGNDDITSGTGWLFNPPYGRFAVVADALWEYDGTLGDWTAAVDAGSLRERWTAMLFGASYAAALRYALIAPLGSSVYLFAGRDSTGTSLHVRRCLYTLCVPPCSLWSCGDDPIGTANEYPAGLVYAGSLPLVVAHYDSPTGTTVDFVRFFDKTGAGVRWYFDHFVTVTAGQVVRTTASGGGWGVAAGEHGLLVVTDGTTATKITVPDFTYQSSTDFVAAHAYDGRLYVLGSYDRTIGGPLPYTQRTFVLVHASTSAVLSSAGNWAVHQLATAGAPFCLPPDCPSLDQQSMNALASDATGLYIFGGWWNSTTDQMDSAVWFWAP